MAMTNGDIYTQQWIFRGKPWIPAGKLLQFANLNMGIEIVDLPSYKMVVFHIVSCMFTRG